MSGIVELVILPANGTNPRPLKVASKQYDRLLKGELWRFMQPGDQVFHAETLECVYVCPHERGAAASHDSAPPTTSVATPPTPSAEQSEPPVSHAEELQRIMEERDAFKARLEAVSDHVLSQRLEINDARHQTQLAEERAAQSRAIAESRRAQSPQEPPSRWRASSAQVAQMLSQVALHCGLRAFHATRKEIMG